MDNPLVYITYQWVGPTGPIGNIRTPDIYDLGMVENHDRIAIANGSRAARETFGPNCADYGNETGANFKVSNASSMTKDDIFMYPITLGHKDQLAMLFDHVFGLFERSRVPNQLLDLVRNGGGYIILEHGFEAFVEDENLDRMHDYLRMHQIPFNKVVYVMGCGNIEEIYDFYCIKRNIPVHNRIRFCKFFPCQESLAINEMRHHYNPEYIPENMPSKTFLSLNLRPRQHRTLLLGLFKKHGLLDDSHFSFAGLMPGQSICGMLDQMHLDACDLSDDIYNELNGEMHKYVLDEDPVNTCDVVYDMDNRDFINKYYQDSLVSVCTETTFHTTIMALTEKCIKPIAYKHPFILCGAQGILKYVNSLGFKSFSDFWDEGYDEIYNPNERLIRIVQICQEINEWSTEQKLEFRRAVKPIIEHNYEHLITNPYSTVYKDLYDYAVNSQEATK